MAYFNIERGKLPPTHPYYKANSTALVNPLCLQTGATSNTASYYDPNVDTSNKRYLINPMTGFLPDSDNFLQNNVGILYAGYALGLENALKTYSIGTSSATATTTGTFTVQKDSNYGYNVLANGSVVGGMSKIAPIIFFELTGGGGGGSGSDRNTRYGSGGGGGGACIRGLIDLSRVSNIYYQVGIGGKAGSEGTSGDLGGASWISVVSSNDILYASGGGGGGKIYASGTGGTGGVGGTGYRSYNGHNMTPGGLTKGVCQTGLYVLAASSGGKGGNGARGDGKPATVGNAASIGDYRMAGKIVMPASSRSSTSLKTPTGIDLSSSSSHIAGGGGSSAVGQGGRPSIAYAIYNGQYTGQDRAGGSFPGGGGGGACCLSPSTDYYSGGAGANGRLYIAFASMRAPS